MSYAIGLDIGGTKVACGLVSETGQVEKSVVVKSNIETAETMFDSVCAAVDALLKEIEIPQEELVLGAGIPGLVNHAEGIAIFQNNLPWTNFPFVKRMRKRYPKIKNFVIDNDVYQATFAEWKASGLKESDTLTFLTASTGIACATIANGEFLRGQGFAGEVGLLPLKDQTGKITTLENLTGGNHLAAYGQAVLKNPNLTTKDLFAGFYAGKKEETQIIQEWIQNFSLGLYTILSVVDPHKLVLGGSVLKLNPQILPFIKEDVKKMMLEVQYNRLDNIVITDYDNNAGLIGAALSAL